MSRRRLAILASLGGLSALVVAMVAVRVVYTGNDYFTNLVWNLFLAWIPFGLAVYAYDGYREGRGRHRLWAAGGLWLLFFPNALYIVTDFKWLRDWAGAPHLVRRRARLAAAWCGLLLGFASLYLIQGVVGRCRRRARLGLRVRDTRARLVRRLPGPIRALELLGRLYAPRPAGAVAVAARCSSAGSPTGAGRDGALHRVPRDELSRLLRVRPAGGRAATQRSPVGGRARARC